MLLKCAPLDRQRLPAVYKIKQVKITRRKTKSYWHDRDPEIIKISIMPITEHQEGRLGL